MNLTSKLEYNMQPLRLKLMFPGAVLRRSAADHLNEGTLPKGDIHVMGLRIVRQIIKAHEGDIYADGDGIVILPGGEERAN